MEINKNQSLLPLYESIFTRCACFFKDGEKEEIKQFIDQYISILSISDYLVKYENNKEITLIIKTPNAIGQIIIKRDSYNQMHLKPEFTIFAIKDILKISVSTFKRFGGLWNYITIDLPAESHISLEYTADDEGVINFIDNLLRGYDLYNEK